MAAQPYPSEPEWWAKVFDPAVAERYAKVHRTYPDPADPKSLIWGHRTAYDICGGMTKEASMVKHLRELEGELGLIPPVTSCVRPFVGALKSAVVDGVHLFADDSGIRRVLADSAFVLMRILKDHPELFDVFVSETVNFRYQMTRTMLFVGGWAGFWDGAEVCPPWPFQKWLYSPQSGFLRPAGLGPVLPGWGAQWEDLFRRLLREYRKRKLRLHLTTGDVQIICADQSQELAFYDLAARVAAEEGGSDVVGLWEITNEYRFNRKFGGAEQDIDQMGRCIEIIERHLPDVLTMQGAVNSEEPDDLRMSVRHGKACTVHITREPIELCFKHTLGVQYWEGRYGAFGHVLNQGEEKGMNAPPDDDHLGDDMFQPSHDVDDMWGLHGLIQVSGQGDNMFTGASVKMTNLNSAVHGYKEIPEVFDRIFPEDVATWRRETAGNGAMLYWTNGKQFRAPCHKSWNTTPPRPVAEWTVYNSQPRSGTGAPPANVSGVIAGTFA